MYVHVTEDSNLLPITYPLHLTELGNRRRQW